MIINFLTNGTRGDIQPLIHWGEYLKSLGHRVNVTAGGNFKELIESAGLSHSSMPVNLQDYMVSPEGKDMIEKISSNPLSYIREMRKLMKRFSLETLEAYWAASQKADLLITTTGALGDVIIAEKLNIPLVEIQLQPLFPSRKYTYPLLPMELPTSGLRKLSYYLMESMLNGIFNKELQTWQQKTFNNVRTYRGGIFAERRRSADLIIGAFSSSLVTRPKDWPDRVAISGFLRPVSQSEKEKLDSPITTFLKSGSAPVYIGFGSIPLKNSEKLFRALGRILNESDNRLILSLPWGEEKCPLKDERLLVIKGAPHDLLFPHLAGAIHHGGAGTVSAALEAGIPQILYPHNADQPFWSRRLYEQELIPKPVPLKKLSFHNLNTALAHIQEKRFKDRATEFQKVIGLEDGCKTAADLIRLLVST